MESLVLLPTVPATSNDSDTTHDYAEIYTPSRERTPWLREPPSHCDGSTSSTNSGSLSEIAAPLPKPPTPPLHRFPSWEAKIYQVANDGLHIAGQSTVEHHEHVNGGTSTVTRVHIVSSGYCDISVPVYATVKGVSIYFGL